MAFAAHLYLRKVDEILDRIASTQTRAIEQAASILADEIRQGRILYAFGTGGHDNRAAEELLWRAGGLAAFCVVLDPGLSLMHGATKATKIERMHGYAKGCWTTTGSARTTRCCSSTPTASTLDHRHGPRVPGRGTRVIAVTSFEFPASVPPTTRRGTRARRTCTRSWRSSLTAASLRGRGGGHRGLPVQGGRHLDAGECLHPERPGLRRRPEAGRSGGGSARLGQCQRPGRDAWNKRLLETYLPRIRHL